uniref:Spondin-like TSP1 domain-containing protein n=1 Tax=Alexandrium andersonii TaxID=327968 RepID=A0A7S2NEM3_9DINO|mmetsp:Transcript_93569/g.209515  ORF Transcript_93569/g.209515 Transcript_93569/m.209515 type:complete len:1527 (+) Transcript_93569:112-4692(+)
MVVVTSSRVAALLLLATQLAAAHECTGYDEEWSRCPDLKECHTCTPVDCQWAEWGEWFAGGGCTGVQFRQRIIQVANNECGTPCEGAKIQSQAATHLEEYKKECEFATKDCVLGEWSQWSHCPDKLSQSERTREVISYPTNGGAACTDVTKETKPCSGPEAVDCVLDDWLGWTGCSVKCGEGRHTRMRKVRTPAKDGGKPCGGDNMLQNMTLETKSCFMDPCESKDCMLGDWQEWSICDASFAPQRYRERSVAQERMGDGAPCPETELMQTAGCPLADKVDCELSEWSEWVACDKTCDGGQTYRSRFLKKPMSEGGSCEASSLREARACDNPACAKPPGDCEVGEWEEWSSCQPACGQGSKTRKRKVIKTADEGGSGCSESLEEISPCQGAACDISDCQWSEWYDWSACTVSCGGGVKRRNRLVAIAPRNGGALCDDKTMEEAVPCNSDTCEHDCRDAAWGEWYDWSPCSASCSSGFRSRRRDVKQDANECGRALSGLREEYQVCENLPSCVVALNCKLSSWSEWSECSKKCNGIQDRTRTIENYARGNGLACPEAALHQIMSCHPKSGALPEGSCAPEAVQDAELSEWSEWGECDRECGGGQKTKTRFLKVNATHGGATLSEPLKIMAACNTQRCGPVEPCTDCQWGEWGEWSECMKCGGQKERHRSITQMPNYCGKQCDIVHAKEVSNCTSQCEESLFCAWNSWSSSSGCDAGCGIKTTMRNRALGIKRLPEGVPFFEGTKNTHCSGAQLQAEKCENYKPCDLPCVRQDGEFTMWSEWTTCTCVGLAWRTRRIQVENNECGVPPSGPLQESKKCTHASCLPVHCLMSEWTAWTDCGDNPNGQSYRHRSIVREPERDGNGCHGNLTETTACYKSCVPEACQVSEWSGWSSCTQTCGGGLQTRSRRVMAHAKCGGEACNENLEEMQTCNMGGCAHDTVDCRWGEWGPWSGWDLQKQRYRRRSIDVFPNGGAECVGPMMQLDQEGHLGEVKDCQYSAWVPGPCDKDCGGGQSVRQRQISVFPTAGGKMCDENLMRIEPCNEHMCNSDDCQLSDWVEWTSCTAGCGVGQQTRTREIRSNRGDGGQGCTAPLSETRPCESSESCEFKDCQWGEWSKWSSCSCDCGGGMQTRDRHIAQSPENGGAACPAGDSEPREELQACNTHPCPEPNCRDGSWSEWSGWSPCSMSCGGGVSYRTRKIATMADECGQPAEGPDREEQFCNEEVACEEPIDCEFSDWGTWSDCSGSCDGIMRRSRRIATYGRGNGAFCKGGLKETAPCSTAPEGSCEQKPPVDCAFNEWGAWSACTSSCSGGTQHRSRTFAHLPAEGGAPCEGGLSEVQECGRNSCLHDPQDCKLDEWQEWSACDKCNGQKKRFRDVLQYASDGGMNCDHLGTEELGECDSPCHTDNTVCAWGDWKEWGQCSAVCGEGRRSRRRYLGAEPTSIFDLEGKSIADPESSASKRFDELRQMRQRLASHSVQGPALAFSGGCLSFLLAFAVIRSVSGASQRRRLTDSRQPLQGNAYDHLPNLE